MIRKCIPLVVLGFLAVAFWGYGERDPVTVIDPIKKSKRVEHVVPAEKKILKVAVSAMISPKETFAYYQGIINFLGAKIGLPATLVQRQTYAEINTLLENKEIDFAFVCSGPYVEGKKHFGMELIAAPVVKGKPVYYSYILAHKDSPFNTFKDLQGKKFAFTDPRSNTGCLVPKYQLAQNGKNFESFFSEYIFTLSHDKAIKSVAQNLVDGAAVDHLIWEYMNKLNPELTSETKIIDKFGPYGIPPVVTHPDYDVAFKKQIQSVLLHMHEDIAGKEILDAINVDKFIVVEDKHYDSVREMVEWLNTQPKESP